MNNNNINKERINNAMEKETLKKYTNEELEKELLGRKKCQFSKTDNCNEWAETVLIKPFNYQKDPICYNCKHWILTAIKRKAKE